MISLIWAMDKNHLIGNGTKLPWHFKEDLLYYKSKTEGKKVLMGDKTYLSLKSYYKTKPLPYETVYVASLEDYHFPDAIMINDVREFLKNVDFDLMVVGGRKIYELALPFADRLYITRINGEYEGNVFFPDFDINDYCLISQKESKELNFMVYERRK